jgi:hypothetical protein
MRSKRKSRHLMAAEHPAIIWQRHIVAEHAVLASNMLVAFEFATTDGAGAGRWVVLLLSLAGWSFGLEGGWRSPRAMMAGQQRHGRAERLALTRERLRRAYDVRDRGAAFSPCKCGRCHTGSGLADNVVEPTRSRKHSRELAAVRLVYSERPIDSCGRTCHKTNAWNRPDGGL